MNNGSSTPITGSAQHGGTNKTLAAPSVIDYRGIAL
jgi:hypothetical protein